MDEDKKWEMLQRALIAGANGDDAKPLVSKRTLFGIRSDIEVKMDAIAKEMEDRHKGE